jgi:NNP family nitrate/nitrite transporter-like MFS transporter
MGATYDEQNHSYTIGLILLCLTAVITLGYTIFGIKKKTTSR